MNPAEFLVALAAIGLAPSGRRLVARPLDGESWGRVASLIGQFGLSGFALLAVREGVLPTNTAQEAELELLGQASSRRTRAATECLEAVVATLDRQSIDCRVLHDASIAALDYPEPQLRPFEVIDVLVAPAHHDDALAVLGDAGVLGAPAGLSRARRRREVRHVASNGVAVGVHASLTPGRVGEVVETPILLASRMRFALGQSQLHGLGAEERLIATCVHGRIAHAPSDPLAQRDVVQLVLRDDLSAKRVERLASSWRVEAALADAVRRSWDTFAVPDVVPISVWSRAYRPHRRERRRWSHPVPPGGRARTAWAEGDALGGRGADDGRR